MPTVRNELIYSKKTVDIKAHAEPELVYRARFVININRRVNLKYQMISYFRTDKKLLFRHEKFDL